MSVKNKLGFEMLVHKSIYRTPFLFAIYVLVQTKGQN
jgi:hypothetical protein